VEVQNRRARANGDLAAKKLAEWKERRPPTFTQRFFFLLNKDKSKEKEIHKTIRSYNGVSLLL
jgi:hypothetical protein